MKISNHASVESIKTKKARHFLFQGWIDAFEDTISVIERFQTASNPMISLALLLLSILITWFIYVPVHELFHVAGCLLSGGEVNELVLDRKYGAALLNKIFPFIIPSSSAYAGRLSGFDPGSDLGYLITVFAPYILTVFPGVWLLTHSAIIKKMWMSGIGFVLGLAPFMSLTGDFFEIGTIFSTKIADHAWQGIPSRTIERFWDLRSDDIFRLISEIAAHPELYGLPGTEKLFQLAAVICAGFFLAVLFSGWTYQLGRMVAFKFEKLLNQ